MSSSTNRLRCRTWARPGSSLWSDSANSFATPSSAPGLMRATMQPRLTLRSAILVSRLLLDPLLGHAHRFLGVLVHVALGRRVLTEQAGPALDVHHSLPDEIERGFDRHGVVGVRCHVPTLPPRAYG